MTTELRDFLNWFDGFAENIKKQPTAAQWTRVKQRFAEMRVGLASSPTNVSTAALAAAGAGLPLAPPPPSPEVLKQLSEIKTKGRAAAAQGQFVGQAMSAGP